jgi:hypothetical protein
MLKDAMEEKYTLYQRRGVVAATVTCPLTVKKLNTDDFCGLRKSSVEMTAQFAERPVP